MCVGRDARVREQRGGIMHDPRFSLSRDFSPRKSPHRANEWRPIFHDQFQRQPAINYAARSFLPSFRCGGKMAIDESGIIAISIFCNTICIYVFLHLWSCCASSCTRYRKIFSTNLFEFNNTCGALTKYYRSSANRT